jgi:hypothetical protein
LTSCTRTLIDLSMITLEHIDVQSNKNMKNTYIFAA